MRSPLFYIVAYLIASAVVIVLWALWGIRRSSQRGRHRQ